MGIGSKVDLKEIDDSYRIRSLVDQLIVYRELCVSCAQEEKRDKKAIDDFNDVLRKTGEENEDQRLKINHQNLLISQLRSSIKGLEADKKVLKQTIEVLKQTIDVLKKNGVKSSEKLIEKENEELIKENANQCLKISHQKDCDDLDSLAEKFKKESKEQKKANEDLDRLNVELTKS